MKIKVTQPFSLRINSNIPVREFPCGEHIISDEEYNHWFMQACIQGEEPRAILLFVDPLVTEEKSEEQKGLSAIEEKTEEQKEPLVFLSHEDFNKLTVAELKSIATHVGIPFDAKSTKEPLIASLLEGQEGKHIVKDGDSYVLVEV